MLRRRDPIFWAATAIFLVALVLGMAVDNAFLLLMVASYLLRPTVHSLGFARKLVDERQLAIEYRASNVAFATVVIGNIVVILALMGQDNHAWEMVVAVLLTTLAVRALARLLMVGDPAVAGPRILLAVGLLLALWGVVEGGLSGAVAHGAPGVLVILLGLASRRVPRAAAVTSLILVAALLGWRATQAVEARQLPGWGEAVALLLIGLPIVVAAVCLFRGAFTAEGGTVTAASAGGTGAPA